MIPKFFPNSSIRIKTTSNSAGKQNRQSIIKQKISIVQKNSKIEEKSNKQSRKSNTSYSLNRSKQKQNEINFVAQKVLNTLNFNGKKRLVLISHNQNVQKIKKQNSERSDTNGELSQQKKYQLKKQSFEDVRQYVRPYNQIRRPLQLSTFSQNTKLSLQKSNYPKLSYQFQFNIQIKPAKKENRRKISLLEQQKLNYNIKANKTIFKIVQNLDIKITPQLIYQKKQNIVNTKNNECQTYIGYLEEKYIGEFARLRQLKKRSYESFEEHYINLQKLGNPNQLYQERLECLDKYLQQGPQNQRQKRVYDLKKKMKTRQDKLQTLFSQLLNKKQTNMKKINQIMQLHLSTFANTAKSAQSLLKVVRKQFQIQNKQKQNRIAQRIETQVARLFQINHKSMNEICEILNKILNTQELQKQWKLSQEDNAQNVMLIRNCAKKLLQINKTAYELFGEPKTFQIVQNDSFKKLSFHERYDKLLEKKCQDCIIVNPKLKMLQTKNKKAVPYIKVLNQLLKQNQKNFFFETQIIEKQSEQQLMKKRAAIQQIEKEVKFQYYKMTNAYIY